MVLAAYKSIMLSIKILMAIIWILSGSLADWINSGAAARTAISHPIKCVIALPGSLIFNFITSLLTLIMYIVCTLAAFSILKYYM